MVRRSSSATFRLNSSGLRCPYSRLSRSTLARLSSSRLRRSSSRRRWWAISFSADVQSTSSSPLLVVVVKALCKLRYAGVHDDGNTLRRPHLLYLSRFLLLRPSTWVYVPHA